MANNPPYTSQSNPVGATSIPRSTQVNPFDTDNDGVVDRAETADSVEWANVASKPSAFTPESHTHILEDITDTTAGGVRLVVTDGAGGAGELTSSKYASMFYNSAGTFAQFYKNEMQGTGDPGVGHDLLSGWSVGSRWLNISTGKEWVCLDNSAGAAVWKETTGGGSSAVSSVFGRTGAVVAAASDYSASQIDNDSSVTGSTVYDALNQIDTDLNQAAFDASTAYGWGDHAAAGYAAASHNHAASDINSGTLAHERGGLEADVSAYSGLVKISGGATSAITDNSANWDTAYSWGDHSTQGYVTSAMTQLSDDGTPALGGDLTLGTNWVTVQGGYGFRDASSNEILAFLPDVSAANYIQVSNKATGGNPYFEAKGSDTNVGINFTAKGAGTFNFNADTDFGNSDLTSIGDVGCGSVSCTSTIESSSGNISAPSGEMSASSFSFSSPSGSPSVVTTDYSGIMGENYSLTGGDYATNVVSGSAGTDGNLVKWDSNGEAVDASIAASAVLTTRTGVYRTLWVPASAMIPRTTNGAAAGTSELATNDIMLDTFDFDTATEEGVGFWVNFGDQWNAGTVKVKAYWTAASGTGTVKWDFAGQSYADSDVLDQALGTEQGVTDTLITANDMHISSATAALTIADATAGEPVYIQVARDVATDTLGVDAQLIGVMIQYQESSTEQSAW